jgi:hypothetical protein
VRLRGARLAGSGINFEDRGGDRAPIGKCAGQHELKGVPGTWHVFGDVLCAQTSAAKRAGSADRALLAFRKGSGGERGISTFRAYCYPDRKATGSIPAPATIEGVARACPMSRPAARKRRPPYAELSRSILPRFEVVTGSGLEPARGN